ncbi:MAG: TMEM198/TM7SF3 family protein [Chloroflexi bacterium]|nr:TMEM198/TM7SF3 family protein [Chloroflexota bacterium]
MLTVLFVSLFAVLFGLAFCFAGYRVFLILLPIWGFFAGLWLGAEATTLIFGGGFLATTTGLAIGLVVGLIFAVLSYLFYIVGVALVAAGFGWALGAGFMVALGLSSGFLVTIVALVVAVIVAGLTLVFNLQKYVIIAITAIGGANAIVLSVLLLLGRVSLDSLKGAGNAIGPILQDSWFWLIAWLIVALAGIVVQIRANRDYTYADNQIPEDWG